MRFLLLSIEFNAGTFSGNGVYACSQARALTQLGHEVLVIAGAPPGHAQAAGAQQAEEAAEAALAQRIIHVELPLWSRLDAGCGWREYAAGAGAADVAAAAAAFAPAAVLGVDWHSVAAYDRLAQGLPGHPPFIYLNYRVYHRTATQEELEVIEAQESRALHLSRCSLVLSRSDADYLRRHFPQATSQQEGVGPLHVLLPALRSDMKRLPPPPPEEDQGVEQEEERGQHGESRVTGQTPASDPAAGLPGEQHQTAAAAAAGAPGTHACGSRRSRRRRYLTCCVRLSPEKEPHRFVELVEELQRRGALQRLGVAPLMAGAGWESEYGRQQRRRMEAAAPQCVIHDTFMGPGDLAEVYAATALNIHPPTYDAFGMTIVEAASQGAPSLVQGRGHVGATDLLSSSAGEVFVCEMDQPISQLADTVEALLGDRPALAAVGQRAQAKARSWGEQDNAAALVGYVQEALAAGGSSSTNAGGAAAAAAPDELS